MKRATTLGEERVSKGWDEKRRKGEERERIEM